MAKKTKVVPKKGKKKPVAKPVVAPKAAASDVALPPVEKSGCN